MRCLVAGLGAIGQRHARNLRHLYGDSLELLAYRRRRLRSVITAELELDDSRDVEDDLDVTTFATLEDALALRPDATFVCTPSSQHLEIAQRAAESGSHLFIEKPVSHTLVGLDRLRSTVAARSLVAAVGCQWRFHPCVQWLKRAVDSGALGRVQRAEFDYAEYLPDWHRYEDYRESYAARAELGGGVILTQIHDYDLAWWLFGQPTLVRAEGGHLSDLEIDVEDTVHAELHGEVLVTVKQSFAASSPRRTIVVESDHGTVTLDLLHARITSDRQSAPVASFDDYLRNDAFVAEVKHFCSCLTERMTPLVPLEDGIAVLQLALAVREALATTRDVHLP